MSEIKACAKAHVRAQNDASLSLHGRGEPRPFKTFSVYPNVHVSDPVTALPNGGLKSISVTKCNRTLSQTRNEAQIHRLPDQCREFHRSSCYFWCESHCNDSVTSNRSLTERK